MNKIGFIGLGVMGLHMALNVSRKMDIPVIAFDISDERLEMYVNEGGKAARDTDEIYTSCDVILQMLPTHKSITDSIMQAADKSLPETIIADMSSADPGIIRDLGDILKKRGMHLLDSPVSGGNPMAEAGNLSIMAGGERTVFEIMRPVLECMGRPVYTGELGSGDTVKLINNMIGGAMLAAMAEAYALAEKAGIDLETLFEATRGGFAGGPLYDNKIPKIISRDFEPGARIAVHYKDIKNARRFASETGMETPVTDRVFEIMDWMVNNNYQDLDQSAMIKYYEERLI